MSIIASIQFVNVLPCSDPVSFSTIVSSLMPKLIMAIMMNEPNMMNSTNHGAIMLIVLTAMFDAIVPSASSNATIAAIPGLSLKAIFESIA